MISTLHPPSPLSPVRSLPVMAIKEHCSEPKRIPKKSSGSMQGGA